MCEIGYVIDIRLDYLYLIFLIDLFVFLELFLLLLFRLSRLVLLLIIDWLLIADDLTD